MEKQVILKRKFSKETLNAMLEDVVEEYFNNGDKLSLPEIMEKTKSLYGKKQVL